MGCPASASKSPSSRGERVLAGRRNAPRLRLSIRADLITLYERTRCILIDLSVTGAQIGLEAPLRIGDTAILQVADLEPFGEVVRADRGPHGGVNGIVFDPPLSEEQVLRVRAFAEQYEKSEARALRDEVRNWVSGVC